MVMVHKDNRQTYSPSWLAWSEGHQPLRGVLHLSDELGELWNDLYHVDSIINILKVIIIILIYYYSYY